MLWLPVALRFVIRETTRVTPTFTDRVLSLVQGNTVRKLIRYSAVSAVGVPVGQVLLNVAVHAWEMNPLSANILIATVFAPVTYLVNKSWVWKHADRDKMAREALIFWVSAVLGVLCSTFTLWIATSLVDTTESVLVSAVTFLIAGLIGFGLVWIGRFLFLDRFVFVDRQHDPEALLVADAS